MPNYRDQRGQESEGRGFNASPLDPCSSSPVFCQYPQLTGDLTRRGHCGLQTLSWLLTPKKLAVPRVGLEIELKAVQVAEQGSESGVRKVLDSGFVFASPQMM